MNYPQHILDRPLAELQDLTVIETGLTGRNSDIDALLMLLDVRSDKIFRRSDLDLLVLAPWLPRICLFDFVIGSDGQLNDAFVRFQGAEIGASYSEITGQSIFAHPKGSWSKEPCFPSDVFLNSGHRS
jgi:hypothetical protein